ncbi:hypothetical protein Tco_0005431 [Tanacetum coccineum]
MKDQLLPSDASPIALSSGYISDSDLEEDNEEDQRRILLTILPTEETMMKMGHLMMTTIYQRDQNLSSGNVESGSIDMASFARRGRWLHWFLMWRRMKASKSHSLHVGLFKGLERVESIANKLKLPQELSRVHNAFHVSNLKKCCSEDPLAIPLEGLHIDDKFHLVM